jgi:hypothetical protein
MPKGTVFNIEACLMRLFVKKIVELSLREEETSLARNSSSNRRLHFTYMNTSSVILIRCSTGVFTSLVRIRRLLCLENRFGNHYTCPKIMYNHI